MKLLHDAEVAELKKILDTPAAISGLRKVWQDQFTYYMKRLKAEALGEKRDMGLIVEFAVRADAAEKAEFVFQEAIKNKETS